jgi:predicted PurR-regulated permease PerM
MKEIYKYVLFILACLLIGLAIWYFQNIVAYILISAVLSLIGSPVVHFFKKIKIKKHHLPDGLCAGITLIMIWTFFGMFFRFFVPIITFEAQKLSTIDTHQLLQALSIPINKMNDFINHVMIQNGNQFSLFDELGDKISSVINIGLFTNIFGSIASALGNIFIALFSISFITFFFLKDENLFGEGILLLVPTKHEEATKRVLNSTKYLLMRYFVGIGAQITGIIILITIGLLFAGLNIKTCLVIALFSGIISVIPYIGPLIGVIFGITIGIASKIQELAAPELGSLFIYIALVYLIVHLIDNILFQPLIFSSSVKAHPLEIFLLILIAGHLAGIMGMLVAIPGYTVIRVFAKQFFNNFKVVKKLTEKI